MRSMVHTTAIRILYGFLSAVFLLGSIALTFVGLLIPLHEYQWDSPARYSLQTSDDSALFIFFACLLSVVLIGVSWGIAKLGKINFSKNTISRVVYLLLVIISLARMVYVIPSLHG